jgi:hypothetical protein
MMDCRVRPGNDDFYEQSSPLATRTKKIEASCAGLTRASITLRKSFSKRMDCRVKPGNDGIFA